MTTPPGCSGARPPFWPFSEGRSPAHYMKIPKSLAARAKTANCSHRLILLDLGIPVLVGLWGLY